jgi:hypothetical protein
MFWEYVVVTVIFSGNFNFEWSTVYIGGQNSSVGIATRYGLDGPGIESRWGARFSAPVQTGPEIHPASYKTGTGSWPRVKRPGRGADHPPPTSAEVTNGLEVYFRLTSVPEEGWPLPLQVYIWVIHNHIFAYEEM